MNTKRAIRRHHAKRLKKKVLWYYGGSHLGSYGLSTPWSKEDCGKIINSRQKCSCPLCCGNPRRAKGTNYKTRQEIIAGEKGQLY